MCVCVSCVLLLASFMFHKRNFRFCRAGTMRFCNFPLVILCMAFFLLLHFSHVICIFLSCCSSQICSRYPLQLLANPLKHIKKVQATFLYLLIFITPVLYFRLLWYFCSQQTHFATSSNSIIIYITCSFCLLLGDLCSGLFFLVGRWRINNDFSP